MNVIGGTVLNLWLSCNFLWPNITLYVLSYFFNQYQSDHTAVGGNQWRDIKQYAMQQNYKQSSEFVSGKAIS